MYSCTCGTHGDKSRIVGSAHVVNGLRSCAYGCLNPFTCCILARRIEQGKCKMCFDPNSIDASMTPEEAQQISRIIHIQNCAPGGPPVDAYMV